MNISEVLRQSKEQLLKNNRESSLASLEAELLLAFVLKKNRTYLFSQNQVELSDYQKRQHKILFKRLLADEPLAYLLKNKEFYGLNFYVNKQVLIPRFETEKLVEIVSEHLIQDWKLKKKSKDTKRKKIIADIGTGSGNIIISLRKICGDRYQYLAIDKSDQALQVAKKNLKAHSLTKSVKLLKSDLLTVLQPKARIDFLVANLPYIGTKIFNAVEANVVKYEPHSALFAGSDGLDLYRQLFKEIKEKEIYWEIIWGEFGDGQCGRMKKILKEFFQGKTIKIWKDQRNCARFFEVSNK